MAHADLFNDSDPMSRLMRSIDWKSTPIGPVEAWPGTLATALSICLASRFPIVIGWGPELLLLYNEAYRPILGARHPHALGRPCYEAYEEIIPYLKPMLDGVLATGVATWEEDFLFPLERNGYVEEAYFTLSHSAIRDESRAIVGIFATVGETTERVLSLRRLRVSSELARRSVHASGAEHTCRLAAEVFEEFHADIVWSALYLVDDHEARLVATSRLEAESLPPRLDLADPSSVARAAREMRTVESTVERELPGSHRVAHDPVIIVPIERTGHGRPSAVLVAGRNPRRALDEAYRSFFGFVARQIGTAIANAIANAEERERAKALAEIGQAKTTFFSNVSHEFRTPLTLLLGPLQDALESRTDPLSAGAREAVELAHRNALRLGKLVNALLDFSRIEAGRVQANYVATDLAAATRELASMFRSAVERAGLVLDVSAIQDLPRPVFVDRGMWEKIVSNLLSNAFKFTFQGRIRVAVGAAGERAEVAIEDTGVGIAEHELPRLFERFHRIEGTRSRTYEGSGIGLSLVESLVGLHGGSIVAASRLGEGTRFTISIPFGFAHLPPDRIDTDPPTTTTAPSASGETYANEALRWLPTDDRGTAPCAETCAERCEGPRAAARILVVDDNADMRGYIARLLRPHWTVEVARDGVDALAAVRAGSFDLVLADVMMPELDGFGLLREMRSDPATAEIPVVMLSARAGEESRIEGFEAGTDDYLVKPFTGRELVTRVRSQLALSRARSFQAVAVRDLVTARADAERANAVKDEFLAMLGHELRNPLAPIVTAVELMAARGDAGLERERSIIDRQVRHLVRLVDDLLDVSRITRGKITLQREEVDLVEVVAAGTETASPLLEHRRHAVQVNVPPGRFFVLGDRARLAQVVSNLVTNAAKYTDPGGHIEITANDDGAHVALRVRDTGIGMPAELVPRVFDLFEQGARTIDRSAGGLGLGLAIVKSIASMHGGSVTATSAGPGCGSEFVVRLPQMRPEERPARSVTPSELPESGPSGARRILIVDDNEDGADLLDSALSMMGHTTRVAHDGPEALEAAREFRPNLALVDIGLPVMDGYEVARRLRAMSDRKCPTLVAVTGYGQESDRRRTREAGFDGHLVKPVELSRLSELVGRLDNTGGLGTSAPGASQRAGAVTQAQ